MKRYILLGAVLVMAFCTPAFAASGGEGNNTGCNGVGNPNSPCVGGQGGAGGAGGSASAVSTSSSSSVSNASASSYSGSSSTSGANASGTYSGSYVGGNTDVRVETPHQAPAVAAPALTAAGTGVCLGSVSIGLSGPMAGASFGITKVDKGCERRSGAALLYQMGYKDAAIRLLSNDPEVKAALDGPQAAAADSMQAAKATPVSELVRRSEEFQAN